MRAVFLRPKTADKPYFCGYNKASSQSAQGTGYKGLFTRERTPKLAAHYFKDRWAKKQPNDR